MGQDIKNVVVFNGKTLWVNTNGNEMVFDKKEDIDAIKESLYSEKMAGLALLGSKDVELSVIGDDKVGDTPVVGVRVSSKGHQGNASAFFDKKRTCSRRSSAVPWISRATWRSSKRASSRSTRRSTASSGRVRVAVMKDGQKQVEIEITEIKWVDKLDEDTFAKPK